MKKRSGIAVLAAVLALSGCAGSMPLDILEKYVSSSREAGEERTSEEDGSEAEPEEASREKQKGGIAAEPEEDGESLDASEEGSGREDAAEDGDDEEKAADRDDGEDGYVKGVTTEEGWESETWNLRFTAPEGVFMVGEEALEALVGLGQEIVSEKHAELEKEYLEETQIYEMMAITSEGNTNVALTAERLMVMGLETEDYRKAVLLQLRLTKNPVYIILEEEGTAEIAGETYAVVKTMVEGDEGYLQDYYIRVAGDNALAIIMTYKEETADRVAEIMAGFDAY